MDGFSIRSRFQATSCRKLLGAALAQLESATPEQAKAIGCSNGLSKPELRDALKRLDEMIFDAPVGDDPQALLFE